MKYQNQETKVDMTSEEYQEYVKKITPAKSLPLQMLKAFLCGGFICMLGQFVINTCLSLGMDMDSALAWCTLCLIALSVVLTGLSLYQVITNWGGAGALVPITGFANSVASTAIEYVPEGMVYGIGVKIFSIAGPVILYGILASWIGGVIYYLSGII